MLIFRKTNVLILILMLLAFPCALVERNHSFSPEQFNIVLSWQFSVLRVCVMETCSQFSIWRKTSCSLSCISAVDPIAQREWDNLSIQNWKLCPSLSSISDKVLNLHRTMELSSWQMLLCHPKSYFPKKAIKYNEIYENSFPRLCSVKNS